MLPKRLAWRTLGCLTTVVLLVVMSACDDAQEEGVQEPAASAPETGITASATGHPTPTPSDRPTSTPTDGGASSTETFYHPGSDHSPAFSFEYPKGWFLRLPMPTPGNGFVVDVFSWDNLAQSTGTVHDFPPGGVKFEIDIFPIAGALTCQLENGEPSSLDGSAASRVDTIYETPRPGGLKQLVVVQAAKGNYCFSLGIYETENALTDAEAESLIGGFRFVPQQ